MSKTIKFKKCQLIKYTYRYKQIGDTIHTLESTMNGQINLLVEKNWQQEFEWDYCGIIRIHGSSIFGVFVGSPSPQIYILNEIFFRKSILF